MAEVKCQCGELLGSQDGAGAELKARRVTVAAGRLRVKCAKCHRFTTIPGLTVIPSSGGVFITAPRATP